MNATVILLCIFVRKIYLLNKIQKEIDEEERKSAYTHSLHGDKGNIRGPGHRSVRVLCVSSSNRTLINKTYSCTGACACVCVRVCAHMYIDRCPHGILHAARLPCRRRVLLVAAHEPRLRRECGRCVQPGKPRRQRRHVRLQRRRRYGGASCELYSTMLFTLQVHTVDYFPDPHVYQLHA